MEESQDTYRYMPLKQFCKYEWGRTAVTRCSKSTETCRIRTNSRLRLWTFLFSQYAASTIINSFKYIICDFGKVLVFSICFTQFSTDGWDQESLDFLKLPQAQSGDDRVTKLWWFLTCKNGIVLVIVIKRWSVLCFSNNICW